MSYGEYSFIKPLVDKELFILGFYIDLQLADLINTDEALYRRQAVEQNPYSPFNISYQNYMQMKSLTNMLLTKRALMLQNYLAGFYYRKSVISNSVITEVMALSIHHLDYNDYGQPKWTIISESLWYSRAIAKFKPIIYQIFYRIMNYVSVYVKEAPLQVYKQHFLETLQRLDYLDRGAAEYTLESISYLNFNKKLVSGIYEGSCFSCMFINLYCGLVPLTTLTPVIKEGVSRIKEKKTYYIVGSDVKTFTIENNEVFMDSRRVELVEGLINKYINPRVVVSYDALGYDTDTMGNFMGVYNLIDYAMSSISIVNQVVTSQTPDPTLNLISTLYKHYHLLKCEKSVLKSFSQAKITNYVSSTDYGMSITQRKKWKFSKPKFRRSIESSIMSKYLRYSFQITNNAQFCEVVFDSRVEGHDIFNRQFVEISEFWYSLTEHTVEPYEEGMFTAAQYQFMAMFGSALYENNYTTIFPKDTFHIYSSCFYAKEREEYFVMTGIHIMPFMSKIFPPNMSGYYLRCFSGAVTLNHYTVKPFFGFQNFEFYMRWFTFTLIHNKGQLDLEVFEVKIQEFLVNDRNPRWSDAEFETRQEEMLSEIEQERRVTYFYSKAGIFEQILRYLHILFRMFIPYEGEEPETIYEPDDLGYKLNFGRYYLNDLLAKTFTAYRIPFKATSMDNLPEISPTIANAYYSGDWKTFYGSLGINPREDFIFDNYNESFRGPNEQIYVSTDFRDTRYPTPIIVEMYDAKMTRLLLVVMYFLLIELQKLNLPKGKLEETYPINTVRENMYKVMLSKRRF